MKTDQLTLFDHSDLLTARARKSDPVTSHEAARNHEASGRADSDRRIILAAVKKFPGHTACELFDLMDQEVKRHNVSRRLSEMRTAGLVRNGEARICTEAGTRQMTWEPC